MLKILIVSIFPYLWMFLLGVLLQRNFEKIAPWVVGKGLYWLAAHGLVAWAVAALGGAIGVNAPNPVSMVVTAFAVVSLAFTAPSTSHRVLRGNDVSYGLYIYHAVVLNVFVTLGLRGTWRALGAALGISSVAAVASWLLVERPALRFKRKSLKAV